MLAQIVIPLFNFIAGVRMKRVVLVLLLLTLSACNYPGRPVLDASQAGQALKETLDALAAQGTLAPATVQAVQTSVAQEVGAATPAPGLAVTAGPPQPLAEQGAFYRYAAQAGDTLAGLAKRFAVPAESISGPQGLSRTGFIDPGTELLIPNNSVEAAYRTPALPDSEVVDGPTAVGFDVAGFVQQAGGPLASYSETVLGEKLNGAQIVERVALESSVNPRLLLAWVELRSGWVSGTRPGPKNPRYPIGFAIPNWEGLYKELVISATHLNAGYYGWRDGSMVEVRLADNRSLRLAPEWNAGSAAVGNLLARLYGQADWAAGLAELGQVTTALFGDAWTRAASIGPLLPPGLTQPELSLPIPPGERWSFTGGPHESWKTGSPRGAIDLAPVTGEQACTVSRAWGLAPAAGVIARSARNVVALDLDGDGQEGTGWVIIFLHLADFERIGEGVFVDADARLGHPSCEGGKVTGTHMHIARKFNGEWLPAGLPLPMTLGGWVVSLGEKNYTGEMHNGEQTVTASPVGPRTSIVVR
jgi:LysM repeat protein